MTYQLDQRIYDLVTGKRIALVGPGRGLMNTRYGAAIGEYDVVCRVNEVFPWEYEEDYGNRTDIIFHSFGGNTINTLTLALERNPFIAQQVKAFILPQLSGGHTDDNRLSSAAEVNRDPQRYGRRGQVPIHHCGDDYWQECAEEIGSTPNTGYMAILLLLKYDITELLICGMDFYADGIEHATAHYPAYMGWGGDNYKAQFPNNPHDQANQLRHFTEVVLPKHGHKIVLQGAVLSSRGADREDATIWQPSPGSLQTPDRSLLEIVHGRRVAMVGPAPYLSGTGSGKIIDDYDVVIRINQVGAFGEEDDYGSRTDVLFHADGRPAIRAIAKARRKHKKYCDQIRYVLSIGRDTDRSLWHELGRKVGWSPNTGIAAICMLMEYYYPAELFVTGFSFYQEGQRVDDRHSKSYQADAERAAHKDETVCAQSGRANQEPQRQWLKRMTDKFSDILRVDGRLASILGEHMPASITTTAPKKYAAYRAYYGEDFIRQSIEAIRPYVDDVFVFWSDRAFADVTGARWDGEWVTFPKPIDRLPEIVLEMAHDDDKIHLIYDHWGMPDGQWSHLINDRILPDYERPSSIICMETDMVVGPDAEQAMCPSEWTTSGPLVSMGEVTFWKTTRHCVTRENPRPGPVIYDMTRIDGDVPDTDKSSWTKGEPLVFMDATAYNMGFCVSPEIMLIKHLTAIAFSSAIEDSAPNVDWYRDTWQSWDYDTNNTDLEIARGYEHFLPRAELYAGGVPAVLTEDA